MRPNIRYADDAGEYDRHALHRPAADPLGLRGLPRSRVALDAKLFDLVAALKTAGEKGLTGGFLAWELALGDTRAVRLLVAYGRVHKGLHQIVGIPGEGYVWGDCRPGVYALSIADNIRRARCHFYIAALLRRQGTAMAAAQLVFDFFEAKAGPSDGIGGKPADDLAALVAAEGVSVSEFLDAFLESLAATPEGRKTLENAGKKHAHILLSRDVLDRVEATIAGAIRELRGSAAPTTPAGQTDGQAA